MARSPLLRLTLIGGLTLSAAASSCRAQDRNKGKVHPVEQASERGSQDSIGAATQEADGTIVLQLRAEGPNGFVGDGLLRYKPTDPDYAMVARHVGPIPKGGSVSVRPFPER